MNDLFVFEANKPIKDIAQKLGISADGTIVKVVYDKKSDIVRFFVRDLDGDIQKLKDALTFFIGKVVDVESEYQGDILTSQKLLELINGKGKYVERIEEVDGKFYIYAIGEFGKTHIANKLKKVKGIDLEKIVIEKVEHTEPTQEPEQLKKTIKEVSNSVTEKKAVSNGNSNGENSFQIEKRNGNDKSPLYTPSLLNSDFSSKRPKLKIKGKVFKIEPIFDKYDIYITDKKDSVVCRISNDKELPEIDKWYIIFVKYQTDDKGNEYYYIESFIEVPSEDRVDNSQEKRIELHAHTKMSDLDSVLAVEKYVETAKKWGWSAIAVTDHANVQAVPEFYELAKSSGIKPIFGCELYVALDPKKIVINEIDADLEDSTYVVIDLETTGLNPREDDIIEIGAVKVKNKEIIDEFHTLVKSDKLSEQSSQITGITQDMLDNAKTMDEVFPKLEKFLKDTVLVAHNADFDTSFLSVLYKKYGKKFDFTYIDTLRFSRSILKKLSSYSLDKLVDHFGLGNFQHHRAFEDAKVTALVFIKLVELAVKKGMDTFQKLNKLVEDVNPLTKYPKHVTVLVKNKVGLKNLYRLISKSHTETFFKVPQVLRSDLEKYREGLLIGTGCSNSEIFELALKGDISALKEALKFYNYIEIMPIDTISKDNQEFSEKDAKEVYRNLYQLGKELNIPVVMVSNAHFLDPEDIKARKVLLAPQSEIYDREANYYLRTTEEMLEEAKKIFEDEQIAREVVIDNPRIIESETEIIKPVEKKLHPPYIEGAEEKLRNMAYERAYQLYGKELPEIVVKRVERELHSIIDHGYAVLYMIAHLIVKKSNEDGYVVGSRGSVGSSLVAHLVGITEVNPLPAHYLCPECHYFELREDYGSGYDLPDKKCPNCGTKLSKNGQDIPFEVFMGFEGDKVPDIDLNFSGEYQERAHKFIEELFGKEHVFRAGTISTIADRSALGYIRSYGEKTGEVLTKAEEARLAEYVANVKRTTGQHPGGLMIVPKDKEVLDFTPYQFPANDKKAGVFTTHFAYESVHDDLVKLDALGHDDPTMVRLLYEYTGVDPMSVPMDDKETISIFSSLKALKISADELGTDVGSLGIPEFGTEFVQGMLKDTRPKTFAELVRISGLSHGTDVWLGNAKDLIDKRIATLNDVIACRDDIMLYLIQKGVPPANSFKIMENVRKGKGLKEDEVKLMKEYNVPDWFIESCKKIKYLFPKAHAVAYVSMAFRIAYFKVHYPLAFYAAFFSTKGDEFDVKTILKGKEAIKQRLSELAKNRKKDVKEKNEEKVFLSALEMILRGFKFLPPKLNESDSKRFKIENKSLLIPFNKIQGVGDSVAVAIVEERNLGLFSSVQDLMNRVKITKAQVEALREAGALEKIPESDQQTLF